MWLGRLYVPEVPDIEGDVEQCGVVIGKRVPQGYYGTDILLLPNLADDPANHFRMEVPRKVLPHVVSLYHSHPEGDPLPSLHDKKVSQRLRLYGLIATPEGSLTTYYGRLACYHYQGEST